LALGWRLAINKGQNANKNKARVKAGAHFANLLTHCQLPNQSLIHVLAKLTTK
jgi:hypothetical protein